MSKMRKLSKEQLRTLRNIKDGLPINSHCKTIFDSSGLQRTRYSLARKGYLTWGDFKITEQGLKALE